MWTLLESRNPRARDHGNAPGLQPGPARPHSASVVFPPSYAPAYTAASLLSPTFLCARIHRKRRVCRIFSLTRSFSLFSLSPIIFFFCHEGFCLREHKNRSILRARPGDNSIFAIFASAYIRVHCFVAVPTCVPIIYYDVVRLYCIIVYACIP